MPIAFVDYALYTNESRKHHTKYVYLLFNNNSCDIYVQFLTTFVTTLVKILSKKKININISYIRYSGIYIL